jgi:hypothetical protein
MRAAAPLAGTLLALVVAACGSSMPEETAPPPTALPDLIVPSFSLAPTDSPDASLRPTFDAAAAAEQLMASVPDALAGRCSSVPPGADVMAEVRCTPAGGADSVDYTLFEGPDRLDAAYQAILDALPAGALDGPGCGKGPGREHLPNGRRACFRRDGEATVAWTNELVYVLAVAGRADGDWAALERFWTDAGPVTP